MSIEDMNILLKKDEKEVYGAVMLIFKITFSYNLARNS